VRVTEVGLYSIVGAVEAKRSGRAAPESAAWAVLTAPGAGHRRRAALVAAVETEPAVCARCALAAVGWTLEQWTPLLATDFATVDVGRPAATDEQFLRIVRASGVDALLCAFLRSPRASTLHHLVRQLASVQPG
jgi:hypothetical protein